MKRIFVLFPTHWILNAATLGPIGKLGQMPGTNGSFVGLIWYTLLFHELSPLSYLIFSLLSAYIACHVCTQAELLLREKDPPCIILDEMVAIPFCFLGLQHFMTNSPIWLYMLIGFLLFRMFDILKPFGIKKLQTLPGGLGIVIDDVAAALATCICLHILTLLFI